MFNDSNCMNDDLQSYINNMCVLESKAQLNLREKTSHLELAVMTISPLQGQFLRTLLALTGAKRILEVGTFCGYSSLVMAEATPNDATITTLDINPSWSDFSDTAWCEAGIRDKIDFRLGPALESLADIKKEMTEPFDFIFIDADKTSYSDYYDYAYDLVKKGGVILVDNIFWDGRVLDEAVDDRQTIAIRDLNHKIRLDKRVDSCMIPIADGLFLVVKR